MIFFRLNLIDLIRSFFPLQLVVMHFKRNLVGVFAWLFFYLIITGNLGDRFGLPILFLSPEYLGETNSFSFFLLGFGFGGLMMAFNTYSYSKLGRHFPFLAFIRRPFLRFCKNNAIIPLIFFMSYLIRMTKFQWEEEYATSWQIVGYNLFFVIGILTFVFFSLIYFFPLSSRFRIISLAADDENRFAFQAAFRRTEGPWFRRLFAKSDQRYLYFGKFFRLCLSRPIDHLDSATVARIRIRNRINTSLFELMTLSLFIGLSLFSDNKIFEVPAAMSVVLLITLLVMLYSILQTWFRRWTPILVVLGSMAMSWMSVNTEYFSFRNYAYGLNYDKNNRPNYSIETIEAHVAKDLDSDSSKSYANYITILENWKKNTGLRKPKLVLVNSSGGGLRSALWTFIVLQKLDQAFNGNLQKNIHMYTGASGGMVGSGYFRELCLRAAKGEINTIYSHEYFDLLGQDVLNKLTFSASTRDLFFRWQYFEYNGMKYPKDRGYALEQQLHENTNFLMDHPLSYYESYEKDGKIPMLILTPTIVNDGRRLIISTQPLCFVSGNRKGKGLGTKSFEYVDYQTFFKDHNPGDLRFSTALRSSATFPFVTPMVTLPTSPEMQLMDAGYRDNYGGKITMELLYHMQDWIKKNTSGVVIIQIRDTKKILDNTTYRQVSLIDKITLPFGNMYSNFPKTQDFDQEQLFKLAAQKFQFPMDVINFNLREKVNDQISLSWHLSAQEKNKIQRAFYSSLNQNAMKQLETILSK